MHTSKTVALLAALSLAAPALAESITCESNNGRERYCPANTRGGVTLSSQLSRDGCYQGDTWGYDRSGIWVSGGCRATFHTGSYSGNNWHESNDYYADKNRSSNYDGAKAAIAIGAILGAVAIASAASNNKGSSSGSAYQRSFDSGCNAGSADRRNGQNSSYWRHSSSYDSRSEQAFESGYNQCWARGR